MTAKPATFFDILGIDPSLTDADRAKKARDLFPGDLVQLAQGVVISLTSDDDKLTIVSDLQSSLSFTNIRPGVDPTVTFDSGIPGQIAFSADVAVKGAPATSQPYYLHAMPDMGIQLVPTDPVHPAKLFVSVDDRGRGYEVIIDSLPVKIFLKEGIASALASPPVTVGSFDPSNIDSFAYTLNDDGHPAEIDCLVRMQLTPERDLIIEPSVPISFGPVRWMGLPATAVYDVQIIPSPNRRDYLEWTHNDIGSFFSNPPAAGALGFRSIDVDFTQPPFTDLHDHVHSDTTQVSNIELVLEDVVVPVTVPVLPIPSHGTFGFRRKITDRTDIKQAYSLSGAPVKLYGSDPQGGSGGSQLVLQVEQFLLRTGDIHASDPADQPQLQLQAEVVSQTSTGPKKGATFGIDDQWTLNAGYEWDLTTTPLHFTIADSTVGLVGLKFGVSVGRLAKGMPFSQSFELLGDLYLTSKPTGGPNSFFQMRSLTGKELSIVARDLGYKLGNLSLDGLQMPDGMQLIFGGTVHIIIEEMGFVEETNGTPYFSFSGGVALGFGGGDKTKAQGGNQDKDASGFGIRVRRLRFRLVEDSTQPLFKLDGLFLKIKYGTVDVEGFGYISNFTDSGWAIKEFGFGVKIVFDAAAMKFSLAAEFIKGSRELLTDPSQHFDYFLAALELGFLPAGPVGLYDIRALVADNMAPNLDSTFPDGEGMALLKWHQSHDQALNMPANRTLADWIAQKDAFDFGVGCGFSLNGCGRAMHLDVFIFFSKSSAETGLLVVGELYLLENPKPIAFVAIEYDFDTEKFGVMAGVSLNLADFASGSIPSWLASVATLTGTIYVGNQPWTIAIGQLADQSTWLSLNFQMTEFLGLDTKAVLAVGLQIVEGGPKAFGAVFSIEAHADWGIGKFILFGSFGVIVGTWKTGSDASGAEIWIQFGFKINLFHVFSFGAEINIRLTYLGKRPWYMTLHAEVKIDTPWFLPDVTFTIDKTFQEALPFDTATTTQSLQSALGIDPTAQKPLPLLAPGLSGALGDAGFVYSFNQLNGLQGTRIADTHGRTDLPIASVDSTIAIDLTQPVSNDSAIATSTYAGTADSGLQKVQDLSVRYGLTSIAVRRAPRFGPTAGAWTDFVTDAQTKLTIGGTAPQSLTFTWDADSRADGKLAPKRLLMNSAAPYTFATQGAQNDEQAVSNDPDFPCCNEGKDRKNLPKPHVLEFSALAIGSRTPRVERFSGDGGAFWVWTSSNTPAVAPGDPVYPAGHVARALPRATAILGVVDFPSPAINGQLEFSWDAFPGKLFFEAYDGVTLAAQQSADLHSSGDTALTLSVNAAGRGISRLLVRVEVDPGSFTGVATHVTGFPPATLLAGIDMFRMSYVTLADALNYVAAIQRCENGTLVGPPGSSATGKLAFLPNHDYEVVVTSSIAVGTKDQGTRSLNLSEAFYFRTKGLPGLNACANVGDDIRLHVESVYPIQRAIPLYRKEPCVLAFENSLSSVLPIDRTPGSGDPPEKAQMFPLELNVDRVVSLNGLKRLTVPTDDWIASHRANPYPPKHTKSSGFATSKVRKARSNDPLVRRHENVRAAVPACGTPQLDHASQVLLHEPIDENGAAGPWEAATGYRATVRQKDGPFAERSGFDVYDLGAFIMQADGTASATLWSVDAGGNLIAPAGSGGRFYASCGELNWNHVQVHSRIDLRTANAAGIAVGVGAGTPVANAIIATVEKDGAGHALVVRRRDASGEHELGRAAVTISGPFLLNVIAYDDVVRASVGEVSVDGIRDAVREGRIALVADGSAAFAGIAAAALDIYSFEFVTSKFGSFSEHLGSFDDNLATVATGAFGGTPSSAATVLAAHAADIPPVMQASADPQERQRLFDTVISALGIGLRKNPLNVSIARVTEASGTIGLLVESPEPISLTRDVTLTLTHHERIWVPSPVGPPLPPPTPYPVALGAPGSVEAVAASAIATLHKPIVDPVPDTFTDALNAVTFTGEEVIVPSSFAVNFQPGDQIVRVITGEVENEIEFYDAQSGVLRQTMSVTRAKQQTPLAMVANMSPGSTTIVRHGGTVGPINHGHWEDKEVPVPFVALSNGAENVVLLLSQGGSALPAGKYTLDAVLDRDRWSATTSADPEQHYHDERTIALQW